MDKEKIKHLANLARLEITEDEAEKYTKEIGDILGYVNQINEVVDADEVGVNQSVEIKNVFREDSEPMESGKYTDDLLKEAPDSHDGYIKVKKILNNNDSA